MLTMFVYSLRAAVVLFLRW